MKKILGIGSALVDFLAQIPNEKLLEELNLPKGSMTYVDIENSVSISKMITEKYGCQRASGGSSANTMSGLAQLGVEAGFLSKVGKDEVGQFFEKQMTDTHVKPLMLKSDTPSGRVMGFITPDGERTFATCLGAAAEMRADDIRPELFDGWDLFYVEGYLVANPSMLRKAIETAKAKGLKIAIDLASYNVVEESRDFLMELVENHVDIVFANEQESFALTGLEPEAALHFLAERCDIAVVKVGAKGAFIQRGEETVTVPPMAAEVVDTTGAGDMWAAGFLAGLVKGKDLKTCGMMGATVAKNIIEVVGAKMDATRWEKIHAAIALF
ncbi:MAG: adenosine kinase [Bacteroidales bacterium]|nr:adenosine kinase [Bacteroidales bacterium]